MRITKKTKRMKRQQQTDRRQTPSTTTTSSSSFATSADDSGKTWSLHNPPVPSTGGTLNRLSTIEELELIATETTKQGALLLLPTQASMDVYDDSSIESSLSSQDLGSENENEDSPRQEEEEEQLVFLDGDKKEKVRLIRFSRLKKERQLLKEIDVDKYMAKREMSPIQEKWNALTMIPSPIFCLWFILSGYWVNPLLVEEAKLDVMSPSDVSGLSGLANDAMADSNGCLAPTWWHGMPALAPLPVVATAFGIIAHAPFSFMYHWEFAHKLGREGRTNHWSRRADQAMIHFASACMAYGTSGSWDFFVANVFYNADCIYRQFVRKVRPRRNQIRILISMLAYTVPVLRRGDLLLFGEIWLVMGASLWFFIAYPIGGWSHAVFHLFIALAPPLIMRAALDLPISQDQMRLAAQCVALQQGN
jgi:hypothetical protein